MSKTPPRRLGRGLSSIISVPEQNVSTSGPEKQSSEKEATPVASQATVAIDQIRANPFQPRQEMGHEELKSLADSIRQNGVIQPIIVRKQDTHYELIAGERRWRASQIVGLKEIPAVVREANDQEMLEMALVENIFREDLNAIDRAQAYRRYCDEFKLTTEEVASRLGEDRTTVTNYLRLLELPNEVKTWVAEGKLAMGHARCLLAIRSPSDLVQAAKQAIEQELSVRGLEKLVREKVAARDGAAKASTQQSEGKRPQIRNLEQTFVQTLGTKVEINESRKKGAGKIVIHYFSLDDFDRVAERLGIPVD